MRAVREAQQAALEACRAEMQGCDNPGLTSAMVIEAIDRHALKAPAEAEKSLEALAAYLVKPAQDDKEKAAILSSDAAAVKEAADAIAEELKTANDSAAELETLATKSNDTEVGAKVGEMKTAIQGYTDTVAKIIDLAATNQDDPALALARGDVASARAMFGEVLRFFKGLADRRGIAYALEGLAAVCAVEAQHDRAITLWSVAATLREAIGSPLQRSKRAAHQARIERIRAAVGLGPRLALLEHLGLDEQRVAVEDRRGVRELLGGEVGDRLARHVRDAHAERERVDERADDDVAALLRLRRVHVVDVERVVVHRDEAEEVVVGLGHGLRREP